MAVAEQPDVDPRIRRTRVLLQDALFNLLKSKPFESITVQDITTEATVSRATFYSHYLDKHDLLNGMTDARFQALDRKSTRLNSSHAIPSRMPSSA